MINVLGHSFGMIQPALLLAAPIVLGLLVYAYLRRGRGPRLAVGTLLLLQKLQRQTAARRNFVPPPRFWFELVLLLLLVIAATRPFQQKPHSLVAILIDNSLSMDARTPTTILAESSLQRACSSATQYIDRLPSGSQVSVYYTSPRLSEIPMVAKTRTEARQAIDKIRLAYAPDQLDGALHNLHQRNYYSAIAVFSDRARPASSAASASGIEYFIQRSNEDGTDASNIAITGLTFKSGPPPQVIVDLTAFSNEAFTVNLTAYEVARQPQPKQIHRRSVSLAAGAIQQVALPVSGQKADAYYITIEETSYPKLDALPADNEAWLVPVPVRPRILLVSPLSPKELGLNKLKHIELGHQDPTKYSLADSSWDAAIVHRFTPPELPDLPTLFVYPSSTSSYLTASSTSSPAEIVDWSRSHPLLEYLDIPLLNLPQTKSLNALWADSLLQTTVGPALIAGESNDMHYAAVGFELFPYQGRENTLLSVLTLNLLKWVTNTNLGSNYLSTNGKLRIDSDSAQIRYLHGPKQSPLELDQTGETEIPLPGVIEITQSGQDTLLAVNYFDPKESALNALTPVETPASFQQPTEISPGSVPLEQWLAGVALILLLGDFLLLLLFERRRSA